MSLVIGVDADGVLTDMSKFNIREGIKVFKNRKINPDGYGPADIFGLTKREETMFGLKVFPKYITKEPPREGASEIIQRLNNAGDELHEITARKFAVLRNPLGAYVRYCFAKWLKKYKMSFKSIEYCSEDCTPRDKWIACSKLSVDVMIEDKPDVALYLAEQGVKVLLFSAPYNKEVQHENITRVYDWYDVYNEILAIKEKYVEIEPVGKVSRDEREQMSDEEKVAYYKAHKKYIKNLDVDFEKMKRSAKKYKLAYSLVKLPASIIYRTKCEGLENVPYQDGIIMASNHLNSADQFYIGTAIGNRQFYGLAASTIKNTMRGKYFAFTEGAIFVDRNDPVSRQKSEEELTKIVVNGKTILIFPEGTRKNKTPEGREQIQLPFKLGTVSIAQKTGSPILPISLYYGNKKYLKFGELLFVKPTDDLINANLELENRIKNMTLESIQEDRIQLTLRRK